MRKCSSAAAIGLTVSLVSAAPALALSKAEKTQNSRIAKALKTSSSASKDAKSALSKARAAQNSANAASKAAGSATNAVAALSNSLIGAINTYGSLAPELGVATVYAGNGPASPSSPAPPLQPVGSVWSGQIPRDGHNAGQTSGTLLYNCTGPAANTSAGCDLQLRVAIRTTRASSDVTGTVGGGVVITGIKTTGANDATGAYFGSLTGDGTTSKPDPVGAVGFSSSAPTTNDGNLVTFTHGPGNLVGVEADHATIHLANPGLYEIQGTLQFFDSK